MKELVTVKIYNSLPDLYMAKSFLESEGIDCSVKDEYINQVYSFAGSALNGAKLEVPVEQAEEAVRLLIEGGFAQKEDYEVPKNLKFADWLKNLFR